MAIANTMEELRKETDYLLKELDKEAKEKDNMETGKVRIGNDVVVTDKDTAELITQAKIYVHTKKIAARMVEQQQEEFNSWGNPWAI
jgi:hypothetical protein